METVIAYGTLIILGFYKNKTNVRPVIVRCFRRFYREERGYPIIVQDRNAAFWGLAYDIDAKELENLDRIEYQYERKMIDATDEHDDVIKGWIYTPRPYFALQYNVKTKEDLSDKFLEKIRASEASVDFPVLLQKIPRKPFCGI